MGFTAEEEVLWLDAFETRLKKRSFEQFGLLLLDFRDCDDEQKFLLQRILFDDHTSPRHWYEYLRYAFRHFDRKNHLQRLVNKALEFVDEAAHRDDPLFLKIHLLLAKLKSTPDEMARYFQLVLANREIGKKHAALYLAWAELEAKKRNFENAISIVNQGLTANAEPRQALMDKILSLSATQENPPALCSELNASCLEATESVQRTKKSSEFFGINCHKIETNKRTHGEKAFSPPKVSMDSLAGQCQTLSEPINRIEDKTSLSGFTSSSSKIPKQPQSTAESRKADLSKYMSDQLRNFDPNMRLKEKSSSAVDETSSRATGDSSITPNPRPPSSSVGPSENKENSLPVHTATSSSVSVRRRPFVVLDNPSGSGQSDTLSIESVVKNKDEMNAFRTKEEYTHSRVKEEEKNAHHIPRRESNGGSSVNEDIAAAKTPIMPKKRNSRESEGEVETERDGSRKRKRVSFSAEDDEAREQGGRNKDERVVDRDVTQQVPRSCPPAEKPSIFHNAAHFITLNAKDYLTLSLLGKGGSSTVRKVLSLSDGAIYALKKVDIREGEDAQAVLESYANEISLLQRLRGTSPYIIDLVDSEVDYDRLSVCMLLEPGDIDLAKLLQHRQRGRENKERTVQGLDPLYARLIWREMLLAVHHIHEHRIIHGDLKPANFVFVKGHLKLIDFGIAKSISADTTNIYRDSQVGTVNYMAPEAISPSVESLAFNRETQQYSLRLGRASDIWSLGCILYQIVYGRPPFASLSTVQKLSAIANPSVPINYPDWADPDAVQSMKRCLQRDPAQRAHINGEHGLLNEPYLRVPFQQTPLTDTATHPSHHTDRPQSFHPSNEARSWGHATSSTSSTTVPDEPHAPISSPPPKAHVAENTSKSTTVNETRIAESLLAALRKALPASLNDHLAMEHWLEELDATALLGFKEKVPDIVRNNETKAETDTVRRREKDTLSLSSSIGFPRSALRSCSAVLESAKKSDGKENNSERPIARPSPILFKTPFRDLKACAPSTRRKSPLKTLSLNLQDHFNDRTRVVGDDTQAKTIKWQRAVPEATEPETIHTRTVTEKRIDGIRKFLCDENDSQTTASEFLDLSFSMNNIL